MKLQAGKFYRDRIGRLRGPLVSVPTSVGEDADDVLFGFREKGDEGAGFDWYEDGRTTTFGSSPEDLVVEVFAPNTKPAAREVAASDGPTVWSDLTPDAKGLLLLAYHEGKQIQMYFDAERGWQDVDPQWAPNRAYRVKPARTTVSIFGYVELLGDDGSWAEWAEDADGQYVITVELENGKPVGVTIHDMYE